MDNDNDQVAQLQHENIKLQDQVNCLKEHMLSLDECCNSIQLKLSEQETQVKSLEHQKKNLCQTLKKKEQIIDILEQNNDAITQEHERLSSEHSLLREKYRQEKLKHKEMEALKIREEELKVAIAKLKEENSRLIHELSVKSEEHLLCDANQNDLQLQIKKLEGEIAELTVTRDILLAAERESQLKVSENTECFSRRSSEWSTTKSEINLSGFNDIDTVLAPPNKDKVSVNLLEEFLEVEVQEKIIAIAQLEKLLSEKKAKESKINELINELKEAINKAKLLKCDCGVNVMLDSSFYDIYNLLLRITNWPEGQSVESKPLTDNPSLAVVVKDGVQTTQPGSIRVVETISIASQTDPIKNLSPVLQFKTFEKFNSNQNQSSSDSDDEEHVLEKNDLGKGFQLFSEHKNCDLDMDMYRMSRTSDVSVSRIEKQVGDQASINSDQNTKNSVDVNLNSKNFVDCNLIGTERKSKQIPNDGSGDKLQSPAEESSKVASGYVQSKKTNVMRKKDNVLNQDEKFSKLDNSTASFEPKNQSTPLASTSKNATETSGTQLLCTLLAVSTNGFPLEPESNDHTYLITKSVINGASSFVNEEIEKKFQDLNFAFKTDLTTTQKRLDLMKRRRDQAESNIESELKTIETKLNNLQYFGSNSDYINLMSELKKQLDFVRNATVQLSSSAEGCGYVRHEEKLLEFVTVVLQHVENMELMKNKLSKILNNLEGNRPQSTLSLDNDIEEDKILRRSVAAMAIEGSCRRRASIATLPRIGSPILETPVNGKGSQWLPSLRTSGNLAKKLSFSQGSSSRSGNNGTTEAEELRRDSIFGRLRTDNKTSEGSIQNIEGRSESRPLSIAESDTLEQVIEGNDSIDSDDSSLHLRQLYESIEEIRNNSISQETVNINYCFRRLIKWNKLLLNASRFRWPDNVLHFVPFYITWYVVFVLALVFVGGIVTGINGCCTYLRLEFTFVWLTVFTSFVLLRRFFRIILPFLFAAILGFALLFLWVSQFVLPGLSREEIKRLFRTFGFVLEVRYLHGPPPV